MPFAFPPTKEEVSYTKLYNKCMSYSNQSFKQLRFGVVVIYQLLTETGKGVNGTSEFLLQFFPHCVSSHSRVDVPLGVPKGIWAGFRQNSEALNHTEGVLFHF